MPSMNARTCASGEVCATQSEFGISRLEHAADPAWSRAQIVLLCPGNGRGSIQPPAHIYWRNPDLHVALLVCPVGHQDRPADTAAGHEFR